MQSLMIVRLLLLLLVLLFFDADCRHEVAH
jgi:hypothetical protein